MHDSVGTFEGMREIPMGSQVRTEHLHARVPPEVKHLGAWPHDSAHLVSRVAQRRYDMATEKARGSRDDDRHCAVFCATRSPTSRFTASIQSGESGGGAPSSSAR